MGEYAKVHGTEVKIGTCEAMYYLRFDDRDLCRPIPNNIDIRRDDIAASCLFRLPFPDEDHLGPGQYADHNRGLRLYRTNDETGYAEDFPGDADMKPGIIQLHHQQSGLLVNVPCHHGMKLPDLGPGIGVFWNGKSYALELSMLRCIKEDGRLQLRPVVACRHCGSKWRFDWSDVWPYLNDEWRQRLGRYAPGSVTKTTT